MRRVLQLPVYRRLLGAYTLNELAWSIGTLALSFLVYDRTGSALGAAAFFLCSQFIPALLSPLVVVRLDHHTPRLTCCRRCTRSRRCRSWRSRWIASHFALVPILLLAALDGVVALVARSLARATTVGGHRGRGAAAGGRRGRQHGVLAVLHGRPGDRRRDRGRVEHERRAAGQLRAVRGDGAAAGDRARAARLGRRARLAPRDACARRCPMCRSGRRSARCWASRPPGSCSSRSRSRPRWCSPSTRCTRARAATGRCCRPGASGRSRAARCTPAGCGRPARRLIAGGVGALGVGFVVMAAGAGAVGGDRRRGDRRSRQRGRVGGRPDGAAGGGRGGLDGGDDERQRVDVRADPRASGSCSAARSPRSPARGRRSGSRGWGRWS